MNVGVLLYYTNYPLNGNKGMLLSPGEKGASSSKYNMFLATFCFSCALHFLFINKLYKNANGSRTLTWSTKPTSNMIRLGNIEHAGLPPFLFSRTMQARTWIGTTSPISTQFAFWFPPPPFSECRKLPFQFVAEIPVLLDHCRKTP